MKRIITVIASVLLAVGLAACGGNSPSGNTASCKAAMTKEFNRAAANPNGPPGTKPAACNGLTNAQLNSIASQILGTKL